MPLTPAQKAWVTRRAAAGTPKPDDLHTKRLRASMRGALDFARRRQEAKSAKGRPSVPVTVTLDQLMAKLAAANYRCALTGLPFWQDDADRFGPTMPSIDRINCDGAYSDANTRVVVLGINSARGRGSLADLYRMADGLLRMRSAQEGDERKRPAIARG